MPNAIRVIDDHGEMTGLSDDDHTNLDLSRKVPVMPVDVFGWPGVAFVNTSTTFNGLAGTLRYFPLPQHETATLKDVTLTTLSTIANHKIRMGLYTTDRTLQPLVLVTDFGEFDISSTATYTFTLNYSIPRGFYLFALNFNQTGSYQAIRGASEYTSWVTDAIGGSVLLRTMSAAYAYGAMPAIPVIWNSLSLSNQGFMYPVLLQYG